MGSISRLQMIHEKILNQDQDHIMHMDINTKVNVFKKQKNTHTHKVTTTVTYSITVVKVFQ